MVWLRCVKRSECTLGFVRLRKNLIEMIYFKAKKYRKKIGKMTLLIDEYEGLADQLTWRMREALEQGLVDKCLAKQKEFREAAELMKRKREALNRWLRRYAA